MSTPGPVLFHARDENGWERMSPPPGMPNCMAFRHRGKGLVALRSMDLGGRWHLSVSQAARIPTWGELGFARDCLLPPDVWLMIAHPPRKYWMNYDSRVLHLWEFRDQELIEQFKFEGEDAQRRGFGTPDSGETPTRRGR